MANITIPLTGLVDAAMLGHLSSMRFLAGMALASVLFEYVYWTFSFLRMGTTGLTAQAYGRQDTRQIYLVFFRAALLGLIIGSLILILQVIIRELGFSLLSGNLEVEAAGRDYFNTRIWGAPATLVNFSILGWFLGREQSENVLWMTLIANLSNVALNYLFIIEWQWAAYGAGLATALSQYLMLLVGLELVRRQGPFPILKTQDVLNKNALVSLFHLNRDLLLRTFCLITAFALFTNVSATFGTIALAANALLLRLLHLSAWLIDGIAYATESLGGILSGAQKWKQLRQLHRISLFASASFGIALAATFGFTWPWIERLLTTHSEIQGVAKGNLFWLLLTIILGALAFSYDGLFLGLTQGRILRNAMLVSTCLIFIPLAWMAFSLESNSLLWFAMAAFMAARAITLAIKTTPILKNLDS
jgi:MATE family multidrug resistance protein